MLLSSRQNWHPENSRAPLARQREVLLLAAQIHRLVLGVVGHPSQRPPYAPTLVRWPCGRCWEARCCARRSAPYVANTSAAFLERLKALAAVLAAATPVAAQRRLPIWRGPMTPSPTRTNHDGIIALPGGGAAQ